jgi:predicted nucleic acid-binding protein
MIIVADTGPVNYLILSGHIDFIARLYGSLILPPAVHRELLHPKAPQDVQQWANALPDWAEVRAPKDASRFTDLGLGEREAISLALEAKADFLLVDETQGRKAAVSHGVHVKGTLGVLEEAADQRLIDLPDAIHKLKATGIFLSDDVVQGVLDRHRERRIGAARSPAQD